MFAQLDIALVALASSSVSLIVIAAWQARILARLRQALAAQTDKLAILEGSLAALLGCSRRVGDRLGDGERVQRALQQQIDKLQFNDDKQLAVQHAMKLLNNGLDVREVTQICDLTEGEAEILQNLKRHQEAA